MAQHFGKNVFIYFLGNDKYLHYFNHWNHRTFCSPNVGTAVTRLSFFGQLVILSQQYHLILKAWNLHAIRSISLAATKKVRVRKNSHLTRSSSCFRKKEKLPARVAKCKCILLSTQKREPCLIMEPKVRFAA